MFPELQGCERDCRYLVGGMYTIFYFPSKYILVTSVLENVV